MKTMRMKTTANVEPGKKTRTKEAIIAKKIMRTKTRLKDPMEVNMEAGKTVKMGDKKILPWEMYKFQCILSLEINVKNNLHKKIYCIKELTICVE